MSNGIRAAALDAAICEALRRGVYGQLDAIAYELSRPWVRLVVYASAHRELRHRLQRLQAAGKIQQARRGVWVLA